MKSKPYLSIVTTSRNDDYEGAMFARMQTAINTLIFQSKLYNLRAELILVEWNPAPDRPLLKDALSFPDDLGPLDIRIIVVPSSVHKRYRCHNKKNIIIRPAVNIGIRRAKGEFIWAPNADILLSNELAKFLSLEKLKKEFFYRAMRCEVHQDILKYSFPKEQLDFCERNIISRNFHKTKSPHGLAEHPVLYVDGADFLVFSKEYWNLLHGYPELNYPGIHADELLCYMAYLAGLKENILKEPMRIYHIDHTRAWSWKLSEGKIHYFLRNKIYHQLNPDGKLKALIRYISNRVLLLPVQIFYDRFGQYFQKTIKSGGWDFNCLYIDSVYKKVLRGMLKGKRPYVYNDNEWGLPQENFTEYVISSSLKP